MMHSLKAQAEIRMVYENQLFNGKNFHVFIYNKTESVSGLHQHDYYEFTIVLTGRYYQEINGKKVLLERGDFVFIPIGSHHQSFYDFGVTRILNVGISKAFFDKHYLPLLPVYFVASQVYALKNEFLSYIESVISSLNFRHTEFNEFIEIVTFNVVNRLRHYRDDRIEDDIPLWLKDAIDGMHDKSRFGENALANMVQLSGKSQEYLTRATRRYYDKTPMQIIHDIRINFAKKQLEITNYSVTDIAFDAGYSSPSLFIKTFKKITSLTPNSYRKNLYSIKETN
ncbi:TPA: transcriptional regulator ChbR [Proteus mirabilis]|uniref:transcriptional regulator ChbR n=1 Tax=Proteus mirabilis TaxID=584 RepID=UPI001A218C1E|nr:transcriptional regulator ChbR [Proteus mirabilis]EKU5911177.1 transcriptional regulator ChbR [Proteus mirabilis]EKW1743445.1 transcriptional regulator ChbR [Proteus mirabilis]MBI6305892.1 transcriptional regulator ChbR [Proteus mirabilis]MCL8533212.1 transcriptional regulator ChbR [Proteus mirabilis]MDC9732117.1 transcriptional regulator ChbR [Proteus mirabilis]